MCCYIRPQLQIDDGFVFICLNIGVLGHCDHFVASGS